jgi:hypothetical protein
MWPTKKPDKRAARGRRHFPARVAHLRAEVFAVQVDHRLQRDQADPDEERLVVARERVDALFGLDVGVLQDVLRIEPADEARMDAEVDHAKQAFAVALEERRELRFVTCAQVAFEGLFGFHCVENSRQDAALHVPVPVPGAREQGPCFMFVKRRRACEEGDGPVARRSLRSPQ